jgi:hypothetical protein
LNSAVRDLSAPFSLSRPRFQTVPANGFDHYRQIDRRPGAFDLAREAITLGEQGPDTIGSLVPISTLQERGGERSSPNVFNDHLQWASGVAADQSIVDKFSDD